MAERVNLLEQNQWEAEPDEELGIPEVYIRQLKFEIVTFTLKKEFTFRCSEYEYTQNNTWEFRDVIIDTSKRGPEGELILKRVTFHPFISLGNVPFMVIPSLEVTD